MSVRLLSILTLIVLLCSCKATKTIQTAIVKKDSVSAEEVSREKARLDTLAFIKSSYEQVNAQRIQYKTFSAKMDVDYEDGEGKRLNVNAQVRGITCLFNSRFGQITR